MSSKSALGVSYTYGPPLLVTRMKGENSTFVLSNQLTCFCDMRPRRFAEKTLSKFSTGWSFSFSVPLTTGSRKGPVPRQKRA